MTENELEQSLQEPQTIPAHLRITRAEADSFGTTDPIGKAVAIQRIAERMKRDYGIPRRAAVAELTQSASREADNFRDQKQD